MIHRFYLLTERQQLIFTLKLAGIFILFNLCAGIVLYYCGLAFLSLFVFALSLSVFAPFVDVPSGVKCGSLIYYSPLLIAEKVKNNRISLHSGSLFDYYFTLNFNHSAAERKKQVFSCYVDGLLALIAQYDCSQPTALRLKATSYILNPRTANKLGLTSCPVDPLQRFILYFNVINLTCALSLLKGKLTWPSMTSIYTFEGTLDELIANKAYLVALKNKLSAAPSN